MVKRKLRIVKRYLISIINVLKSVGNKDISQLKNATKISRWEIAKLRSNFASKDHSVLAGKKIEIVDSFWHLHSLKEIFVEQTYKFKSKSDTPTILDCGANIGLSAIFFKQQYPKANIIAFEPDAKIFSKLRNNLKAFNLHDVKLYNNAIWTEDTVLNFDQDNALGGRINHAESHSNTTQVSALALTPFINKRIDFLKIDIEGAEFDVLKSIEHKLLLVENLFIEYHSDPQQPQKLAELLTIIDHAGFRLYIKEAWNNLPIPFEHSVYKPFWDLQLNIFAYRN